ncbi:MAG: CocE/NonD family hydrolase [Planctomycetota bacterium]
MNHVLFLFFAIAQAVAGDHRLSAFGRYAGYSRAEYDGWQRSSFFIAVRDGTRLACDLFRPTLEGKLATRKLPLVWTHHRYQRCVREGGRERTILDIYPHLTTLLAHGYLVAAVDVRGSGASFGVWRGLFHDDETRDARDVIEWFAAQDFCDGNIGMFGSSYLGGDEFWRRASRRRT